MLKVLDEINLKPDEDSIHSERAKKYLKIIRFTEALEKEKEKITAMLDEDEKKEVFQALSKQFGIPYYVNVTGAADIMGISPQMVRRHCADGNLKATQTLQGSGKWRIETNQLMDQPNWEKYLEKRAQIKLQSHSLADKMIDYLDDDEIE